MTWEQRAELVELMCGAYCQTSENGGGATRYTRAMQRILTAVEGAGWTVTPPPAKNPKKPGS